MLIDFVLMMLRFISVRLRLCRRRDAEDDLVARGLEGSSSQADDGRRGRVVQRARVREDVGGGGVGRCTGRQLVGCSTRARLHALLRYGGEGGGGGGGVLRSQSLQCGRPNALAQLHRRDQTALHVAQLHASHDDQMERRGGVCSGIGARRRRASRLTAR